MDLRFEFSQLTMAYLAEYRAVRDAFLEAPTSENERRLDVASQNLAIQFSHDAAENGV